MNFLFGETLLNSNNSAVMTMMQVGLQAYLMWEQAGKPDGANFSDDARRQLEQQLQSGKSVQDLERALKGPSDQPQQQEQQPAQVVPIPLQL